MAKRNWPRKKQQSTKHYTENKSWPTLHNINNIFICTIYNQSTITISNLGWLAYVVYRRFPQYFSYIVAVTFIGGGNRSNQRIPPTCRRSLTNFITYCCIKYTTPWTWFELTTVVVIAEIVESLTAIRSVIML
jgi:hypothetical protein